MKRISIFIALLVMTLSICCVSGDIGAQTGTNNANRRITIVNDTGYTIWYIYISPSTETSWGIDRLGDDVIMDGESFTLNLSNPIAEQYDIQLEDSDGDTYTKENVRITANATIVFTIDDIDLD